MIEYISYQSLLIKNSNKIKIGIDTDMLYQDNLLTLIRHTQIMTKIAQLFDDNL